MLPYLVAQPVPRLLEPRPYHVDPVTEDWFPRTSASVNNERTVPPKRDLFAVISYFYSKFASQLISVLMS